MATRMQQRRGTAAQWTAANPILAAGEIGFETDTSKFKMGNGSSTWSALQYFANASELAAIIGGDMPALLNSLDELAQAINDDPQFYLTMGTNLTNHQNDTTMIHGIVDTALLATTGDVNTAATGAAVALAAHEADTTNVHGIADTSLLLTTAHESDTTNIHGIADTSLLATTANVATALSSASSALTAHEADTTNVHGIADTSVLATVTNVSTAKSEAIADAATAADGKVSTHNSDTTDVHGIGDTSLLATTSDITAHNLETENVHGIADTSVLVTQTQLTDAVNGAVVDQSTLAGIGIDWNATSEAFDIDSTVATKTYADDAVSTHNSDTTNVHGIADTSLLATTADVAAVTKTTLGLGNVDNTSDADKPVSTATVTAIATAKSEAIAEVTAVIDGAPNALNTLNELAAALGDDANFASTVTASLAAKVDSYTPITQKTASYTLSTLNHRDDLIEMNSASALTLTIPLNSSIAYPVGTSLDILQTGAGQVTIAGAAGVTVNATPGLKLRTQWSSATLFKRAENTWVVYGDLTA
jgi:hypothetical protein